MTAKCKWPGKVRSLPLILSLVREGRRCTKDIPTQHALNGSGINGIFNEKLSLH